MKLSRKQVKDNIAGYLFSAPAVGLFLTVGIFSIFLSIFLSFVSWSGKISTSRFVWFENYKTFFGYNAVLTDTFIKSMVHTVIVAVVTVCTIIPIAFVLSFLVNRLANKLVGIYRTLFFLPMVCSGVAVYAMWRTMFLSDKVKGFGADQVHYSGLVNSFLKAIGLGALSQPDGWLGTSTTALGAVIVTVIWASIPGVLILYYAGLKTVDNELYESADIDGAKMHHKLIYITWPLLKPITALVTVQLLNGAFQMFENIWVLTQGGPSAATEVTGTLIYKIAFKGDYGSGGYGQGSAMGWVVFIITLALSYVVVRFFGTEKEEGVKK